MNLDASAAAQYQPVLAVTDPATGTLPAILCASVTFANVTITENVAHASHTVTGMSGGVNPAR